MNGVKGLKYDLILLQKILEIATGVDRYSSNLLLWQR